MPLHVFLAKLWQEQPWTNNDARSRRRDVAQQNEVAEYLVAEHLRGDVFLGIP